MVQIRKILCAVLQGCVVCSMLYLAGCASAAHVRGQMAVASEAYQQQNYGEAFQTMHKLAQKGDARAEYTLGYMYYEGIGTPYDLVQAREWMLKAADKHDPLAIQALTIIEQNNPNPYGGVETNGRGLAAKQPVVQSALPRTSYQHRSHHSRRSQQRTARSVRGAGQYRSAKKYPGRSQFRPSVDRRPALQSKPSTKRLTRPLTKPSVKQQAKPRPQPHSQYKPDAKTTHAANGLAYRRPAPSSAWRMTQPALQPPSVSIARSKDLQLPAPSQTA